MVEPKHFADISPVAKKRNFNLISIPKSAKHLEFYFRLSVKIEVSLFQCRRLR